MGKVNEKMTHRERQALATVTLIVNASGKLFLQRGYGATTIEAIAAEAGVAVSTVYAIFKNKRGILSAIREDWHRTSGQRDLYSAALDQANIRQRLELAAHATRRQWETGATMIAIYRGAAAVDPEAAAELDAALQGRRKHIDQFVEASRTLFRPGLTQAKAAAIFRVLTLAEVYEELVMNAGWSADDYERWLADTLVGQLA